MAITYNKDGAYIEITENGVVYRRAIKWEDCVVSVPSGSNLKIDSAYINGSDQLILVLEDESEITVTADLTAHLAAADPHTGYILESLLDAQTIIAAISDNTPIAVVIAEQRLVGRITGGNVAGLTAAQVRALINVENGATADLTGLQIVTLLQALAAGSRLDHGAGLKGLTHNDHPQYIKHSLATAVNNFLVASGAGVFVKKTLAEVKTLLAIASDIATHAGLTTGAHGAGSDHLALFGVASTVVSKWVWKDASTRELLVEGRTTDLTWTDLDMTTGTSTSAVAMYGRSIILLTSWTSGYVTMRLRKNGTTPTYYPDIYGDNQDCAAKINNQNVICGLDTDEILEYYLDFSGVAEATFLIDLFAYLE